MANIVFFENRNSFRFRHTAVDSDLCGEKKVVHYPFNTRHSLLTVLIFFTKGLEIQREKRSSDVVNNSPHHCSAPLIGLTHALQGKGKKTEV